MAVTPQWQNVTPSFRGSSSSMGNAQRATASAVNTIGDMRKIAMAEEQQKNALLQQGVENERANAGLLLQQNADVRAQDTLARNIGKDRAAQVGAEQTNLALVDPSGYKDKLLAAQQQQAATDQVLNSYNLDTPEGEAAFLADKSVDNTSLLNNMQKADMSKINKQDVENKQNYSNKILTNIAAMPYSQRANAVKSLQEDGQFLPDTNTAKTVAALLTPPETKEVTGTVTIGKDGKYTAIPISQLARYKQEGWTEGKPFKGSGNSGTATSKQNNVNEKAWNELYTKADDFGVNILGIKPSDDVKVSKKSLDMMKAIGMDVNVATRIMNNIDGAGGDKELSMETLNNPEIIPPVYDPISGNSMPYGDALQSAYDKGLTLTVDDQGRTVFAPRPETVKKEEKGLLATPEKEAPSKEVNVSTSGTPKEEGSFLDAAQKQELVDYANNLSVLGSKEQNEVIDNALNFGGANAIRKGAPILKQGLDDALVAARKNVDSIFGKVRTPGKTSGVTKVDSGKILTPTASAQKAEFLKKASDEVAVLLSKAQPSAADIARLKEIGTNYPSLREGIISYMK